MTTVRLYRASPHVFASLQNLLKAIIASGRTSSISWTTAGIFSFARFIVAKSLLLSIETSFPSAFLTTSIGSHEYHLFFIVSYISSYRAQPTVLWLNLISDAVVFMPNFRTAMFHKAFVPNHAAKSIHVFIIAFDSQPRPVLLSHQLTGLNRVAKSVAWETSPQDHNCLTPSETKACHSIT